MMRLLEIIIQKRNPDFRFDRNLNKRAFIQFTWVQIICLMRGLKLYFYGKNPKRALLGKNVTFFNPSRFSFQEYMKLGNQVHISALGKGGVKLGKNVSIGAYSRLIVSTTLNNIGTHITLGSNVGMGEYAYLGGAGGIVIGDDCIIGQYFSCHSENHHYEDPQIEIRKQGVSRQGITIGSNCWIGSKVTILDGVTIGNGCVVAAGAVVNKSFPDNSIIAGVPAKFIKSRLS